MTCSCRIHSCNDDDDDDDDYIYIYVATGVGYGHRMHSASNCGNGLQWAFALVGGPKSVKQDQLGRRVEDALAEGNMLVLNHSDSPPSMVIGDNQRGLM